MLEAVICPDDMKRGGGVAARKYVCTAVGLGDQLAETRGGDRKRKTS